MSELKSDVAEKGPVTEPTGRLTTVILIVILAVLISMALVAALFDLESRSRQWDAHAERAVVERVHALGGTYYTTGTDQKGPLWLGFYSLADRLSSPEGFWFAVAALIIAVAVVTGAASAFSGYLASRNWPGALAGGVGVTMYLIKRGSDSLPVRLHGDVRVRLGGNRTRLGVCIECESHDGAAVIGLLPGKGRGFQGGPSMSQVPTR